MPWFAAGAASVDAVRLNHLLLPFVSLAPTGVRAAALSSSSSTSAFPLSFALSAALVSTSRTSVAMSRSMSAAAASAEWDAFAVVVPLL